MKNMVQIPTNSAGRQSVRLASTFWSKSPGRRPHTVRAKCRRYPVKGQLDGTTPQGVSAKLETGGREKPYSKYSHPRAVGAWTDQPFDGPPGLRWLDTGFTNSLMPLTKEKRKRKLHPGVRGLDLDDWVLLEPATFASDVELKQTLLDDATYRANHLQPGDEDTLEAQGEVLELLCEHLEHRYPDNFRCTRAPDQSIPQEVEVRQGGLRLTVRPEECGSMLEAAARLVQEDLVLMRSPPGAPEQFDTVSACVCFSFGLIKERVGDKHSMQRLHSKVGGYEKDLHTPVSKMMARMRAETPVWRTNWSFSFTNSMAPHEDRYLLNPEKQLRVFPDVVQDEWTGLDGALRRIDTYGTGEAMFVRSEYQTLRRLPRNHDYVLFTVHTYLTPLSALKEHPAATEQLARNAQAATEHPIGGYKGLNDARLASRVLEYLEGL